MRSRAEESGSSTEGHDRPDRHATAEAFCQRDDVGLDALSLMSEPLACATNPCLDLIDDEQGSVLAGDRPRCREIARRSRNDSAFTLNRLQEHRGGRVIHDSLKCLDISEGHDMDITGQRAEWFLLRRLRRERQRTHRAAMERLVSDDDLGAPGQARDLEGGLIRLGSGVAQQHTTLAVARGVEERDEPFSESDRGRGDCEVAGVAERRHLVTHGSDDGGMCVAERVDRDAGEQIEVLVTIGIPHPCAISAHQGQWRCAVVVHERTTPAGLPFLRVLHRGCGQG